MSKYILILVIFGHRATSDIAEINKKFLLAHWDFQRCNNSIASNFAHFNSLNDKDTIGISWVKNTI